MLRLLTKPLRNYQGAAIITALFIMTLVAIVATAMSVRFQIDIHRTQLMLTTDKLYLASQAVEFWATGELQNAAASANPRQNNLKIDQLPQNFPAAIFPYPDVSITGSLEDLQAKFNVNNLQKSSEIGRFAQLINIVDPQITSVQATAIASAVAAWINPSTLDATSNNMDLYYSRQHPSYQSAHSPLVSISELRLIRGITGKLYQELAPLVCALPQATPININTAPLAVLQTLGMGLTIEQANVIINNRGKNGYNSLDEFTKIPQLNDMGIPNGQITVVSKYFLATAIAQSHQQQMLVFTTLFRDKVYNNFVTTTLKQSINAM